MYPAGSVVGAVPALQATVPVETGATLSTELKLMPTHTALPLTIIARTAERPPEASVPESLTMEAWSVVSAIAVPMTI